MADDQPETDSPSGLNIAGAITEQLTEQIKNMDVMSVLQKMISTSPADEESEEVRQKLKGVLDQFNSMNDQDKSRFAAKIKEGLANRLTAKLKDSNMDLSGLEEAIQTAVMNQLYLVGAAILFFIILIVFFGYKLYKSLKEKEVKKEEKKKAKQMKKKK